MSHALRHRMKGGRRVISDHGQAKGQPLSEYCCSQRVKGKILYTIKRQSTIIVRLQ